jgi:hypothetical protein
MKVQAPTGCFMSKSGSGSHLLTASCGIWRMKRNRGYTHRIHEEAGHMAHNVILYSVDG